jgi:hypothetical protein
MNEINIGTIKLPVNAATKTFAVLAKRGAGKTYTAAVMAEEFFKAGIPFVVIDPIDVWWGLRVAADGKGKGLPIVVFGTNNADIPLNRDMGREIARAIVRDNVSCVISTYGMPKVAQRHLIAEFAEELLAINNTPRHVFVEEAHEFVPQRVMGAMSKTFSAVEALVVMGRNKGLGVTLINQRAATVNKDVLTQLDTLIALRSVGPQDRKALADWVEAHAAEGDFKKFIDSLPSLPTGEAWIWSPEFMGVFERVKIRKRETFHPDPEKIGSKDFELPQIQPADVQDFILKFKTSKTGSTITTKVSDAPKKPLGLRADIVIADEMRDFESELRTLRNDYESKLMAKDIEIRRLNGVILAAQRALGTSNAIVEGSPDAYHGVGNEANAMLDKLGGMPKKIYSLLLEHPSGLTKRQIALMCAYSVNSGSYRNALSKLRTMGLLGKNGDIWQALTR